MMKWVDMTIYSQGDKERVPRILGIKKGTFTIKIHRHKDCPNTWFLSCHELGISGRDLETDIFEEAAQKAIAVLIEHLDRYVALQNILKNENLTAK